MTVKQRLTQRYDEQNLEAAKIIESDARKYPPGSGAAIWAEMVLKRLGPPPDHEAGPLFGGTR
jgi:hypothetical protein